MHIDSDEERYWQSAPRLPYQPEMDPNRDDLFLRGSSDYNEDEGVKEQGRPHVFREVIETIVVTLLIFFVVRAVVQNFKVEGDSMLPTLHTEEYLLVNKGLYFRYDANFIARLANPNVPTDMRYLFHGPQRGDIIVFESWHEPRDFIKRVIAVEGETVEIKRDTDPVGTPGHDCGQCGVYVNRVKLNELYIRQTPDYDVAPIVVPPGDVFVLGDNRRNSSDSHVPENGPLAVERIIGTAFVTYWPQDQWGLLPHPTYAEMEKKP